MADGPDQIELAAENAADDWEQLIDPVTAPLEKLVDRSGSLEAIRDGLAELVDRMDVGPIQERLARGTFSARLAGDASIGREVAEG
jgi:phage gp29-like protein